jgi:hypothetical protein
MTQIIVLRFVPFHFLDCEGMKGWKRRVLGENGLELYKRYKASLLFVH